MMTAQTKWVDIMQQDNLRYFVDYFNHSGGDINRCIHYKGEDHQLLALAIRLNAKELEEYALSQPIKLDKICLNKTILQYAVEYGDIETLKALISKGADTNQKSKDGLSVLDYAKKLNKKDAITYLESLN